MQLKRIRLPNGNFITRKVVESDPARLAAAKPEEIWSMNEGKSNSGKTTYRREILIRDMEVTHLINAMRLQIFQAYNKMKTLGVPTISTNIQLCGSIEVEKILVENPELSRDVVAFAQKTMPHFSVMQDELDIRLGRKQRKPEQVQEHVARKFDFS